MVVSGMRRDGQSHHGVRVLSVALIALTAFRFWTANFIGLHPDEAYYWLWSTQPSAGYYDHPPMVAWWIWLSGALFGHDLIGVRAFAVASTLISSILVYDTMLELGAERGLACRATLWLNAMLLVGFTAFVATPDDASMLFWAFTTWVLARLRKTARQPLWLLVGLVAGLGCVSKYTNFFIGPAILLWLATDKEVRRETSWRWLVAGGVVALLAFMPVLVWNSNHHWISFFKQFGRIGDGGLTLRYVADFTLGQFGLINPAICVFLVMGLVRAGKSPERAPERFLAVITAPLLLYMGLHCLHDRVQANWLSPLYPSFAMMAAIEAMRWQQSRGFRRLAAAVLPVGLGLPCLVLGYVATTGEGGLPFASPLDPLLGWKSWASQIERIRQDHAAVWIGTADYGVTGELAFYAADPLIIQEVVDRERYTFRPPAPFMADQPGLLVLRSRDRTMADLSACFSTVADLGQITRKANGRLIERYDLFKVTAATSDIADQGCDAILPQATIDQR